MIWRLNTKAHHELLARAFGGDKDIARIIALLHRSQCLITNLLMRKNVKDDYHKWRIAGGQCVGNYYADDHFDKFFDLWFKPEKRKAGGAR